MFSDSQHILVVQPLVGIGDMVWHKPWIDNLIARHKVTLATKPTVQAQLLFYGAGPEFNILNIERSLRGKRCRHDGIIGFFRLVRDFRASRADTAIILHHSPRYALAARLAGIKIRMGFGRKSQQKHLNFGQFLPAADLARHATARIKKFAELNGFGLDNPKWRLSLSPKAISTADAYLRANGLIEDLPNISGKGKSRKDTSPADKTPKEKPGEKCLPYLCLGIGAMHVERQWGAEKFSQLIIGLHKMRPDLRIVLVAGPQDGDCLADILGHLAPLPDISAPLVLKDRLDVACAILARAKGYVGNDTSLLNLSVCVDTPALGLFSQSEPLTYSPLIHQLGLFPEAAYGTPGLINKIQTDDVLQAIARIWPAGKRANTGR